MNLPALNFVDMRLGRRQILALGCLMAFCPVGQADGLDAQANVLQQWQGRFDREVDRRLDVPTADQKVYLELLQLSLTGAGITDVAAQAFVLVDRSPQVQAAFLIVKTSAGGWFWLGASPVSTGKVGTFEHFTTPLGVFTHSLDNPDFRSEGTFNKNHIRGYGLRGRRVFDFGWQTAERGWGQGGTSQMRLQMHATDPTLLAPRLGQVASEGCIRIPGTLNAFIDKHGVLDAAYEAALADGQKLWIIQPGRPIVPWPGRYMVIVDSQTTERPAWSPIPEVPAGPSAKPPVVTPAVPVARVLSPMAVK
jgi:hypothetical protein